MNLDLGVEDTEPVDPDAVGEAEDATAEGTEPVPTEPADRSAWPGWVALLVVCVAIALLAIGSLRWWQAAHDEDLALAQTRDQVLIETRRDVAVLTTLDHRDVDAGLDRWLSVSTGPLHDQLAGVDDEARQALEDAGKVSTGTVVDAALTALDERAGTATAIATVEITVSEGTGEPTVKRDRFTVELARAGDRWLVARLDQLPVGLS